VLGRCGDRQDKRVFVNQAKGVSSNKGSWVS
jgi:hypothetical protein